MPNVSNILAAEWDEAISYEPSAVSCQLIGSSLRSQFNPIGGSRSTSRTLHKLMAES